MEGIIKILLCEFFHLICTIVQAQNLMVQGKIVSKADGELIIEATILETDKKSNGTITNIDGFFTLSLQNDVEFTISYLGFNIVHIKTQATLIIVLKEDQEILQEVVVTGYSTQHKADLTGTIFLVSIDDIAKQNENNFMKVLQERVSDMNIMADGNPSGKPTICIPSIGSLNNNDPLYIIVGVPTKSGMHELNGNYIESIQVLKDGASASIYGSRVANEVIIITTKKGKNGQLRFEFDASIAASLYSITMEILNIEEYGRTMWQVFVNEGQDPNTNALGYKYNWEYAFSGYLKLNGISMSKYFNSGNIVSAADMDWFDQTTCSNITQQYNISVGNGYEIGNSFFSLGCYKNLGIIKKLILNDSQHV